jgi:hypothetical protein
LKSYSVDVEYWWDGAGDTHEMLGVREWLAGAQLTPAELARLVEIDDAVLRLADAARGDGWDVAMLRKTAELIRHTRMDQLQAA